MKTLDSTTANSTHFLGISIAVALHVAGLSLLDLNATKIPEPEIITPQPIMVEWVSNTPQKETQLIQFKAETVQPKVEQSKPKTPPKPVKKTQPKVQKTVTKTEPLIANNTSSVSKIHAETQEKIEPILEKTLLKAEPISQSASNISSNNSAPLNQSEKMPVTLPSLNASYLQNPAPTYPATARQNGEEGKVLLRVFVNEAGTVEKLTLKKSSGYELLDDAAKETVGKWQFVPAKQGDKTVSAWVVVPISFNLEG